MGYFVWNIIFIMVTVLTLRFSNTFNKYFIQEFRVNMVGLVDEMDCIEGQIQK